MVLILFNQFGRKKESNISSQNKNRVKTKENKPIQEKPTPGKLKKI